MPSTAFTTQSLAAEPKAALVIVHGLAEYGARYQPIAAQLAKRGISTFAFDLTGHGPHANPRTHIDSFDLFVDEASDACDIAAALQPHVPVFVWGHSMGAIVALHLLARHDHTLAGVIISSNSLEVFKQTLNPLHPFFKFLSRVLPRLRIPLGLDSSKMSSDEFVQRAHATDPLISSTASLKLIVEFAVACESAREEARNIRAPILIVHGEDDQIAPARGAQLLFDAIASNDKQLVIYQNLRHEIQNERTADREMFLSALEQWVKQRTIAKAVEGQ